MSSESTEIKWVTIDEAKELINKDDFAMQRKLKKYENILVNSTFYCDNKFDLIELL